MSAKNTTHKASRVIVCAAVRYPCGTMLVGPRHFDAVMLAQFRRLFAPGAAPSEDEGECGFLDQGGAFLTREAAYIVAASSSQILREDRAVNGRLFSECLYPDL